MELWRTCERLDYMLLRQSDHLEGELEGTLSLWVSIQNLTSNYQYRTLTCWTGSHVRQDTLSFLSVHIETCKIYIHFEIWLSLKALIPAAEGGVAPEFATLPKQKRELG